jgi:hypothetical protein
MELKQLADELREGHAFRYLNGELKGHCGPEAGTKANRTNWELVKIAARCAECDAMATSDEIKVALVGARDAKSFWELVAKDVKHGNGRRWSLDPVEDE